VRIFFDLRVDVVSPSHKLVRGHPQKKNKKKKRKKKGKKKKGKQKKEKKKRPPFIGKAPGE